MGTLAFVRRDMAGNALPPRQWKPVFYTSMEAAKAQTGYFQLSSMKITTELGEKVLNYVRANGLLTWHQRNQARTSNGYYTFLFTLKFYSGHAYLTGQGAAGYYKGQKSSDIDPGRAYGEDANIVRQRTPTLYQLYFWIAQKYPSHIIAMDYQTVGREPSDDGDDEGDFIPLPA